MFIFPLFILLSCPSPTASLLKFSSLYLFELLFPPLSLPSSSSKHRLNPSLLFLLVFSLLRLSSHSTFFFCTTILNVPFSCSRAAPFTDKLSSFFPTAPRTLDSGWIRPVLLYERNEFFRVLCRRWRYSLSYPHCASLLQLYDRYRASWLGTWTYGTCGFSAPDGGERPDSFL